MRKEITRNRSRRSAAYDRPKTAGRGRSRSNDHAPLSRADEKHPGRLTAGREANGGERLQKVLARAGIASRRQIESWVAQGRITVDGQGATLGQRIEPHQIVHIDGRRLPGGAVNPKRRILIYHKPEGRLCTRADPQGRPTVFSDLPKLRQGRWISIGRLDFNSSGLLLFTNDGELAHRAMHPKYELEREYAVRVLGNVQDSKLKRLTDGIKLEDGIARFESVREAGGAGANHWYHIILKEGRNREVRRLWEAVGVPVSRLIRVRYGPVTMPRRLHQRKTMDLDPDQAELLIEMLGLAPSTNGRESARAKPRLTMRAARSRKQSADRKGRLRHSN
jgi:23S rRNA pseudouridine2605 synthase